MAGVYSESIIRTFRKVWFMLFISAFMISLYGQNQVFTSSGTFTVPAGVTSIIVECWGAGGAGGGATANTTYGGGGGAGGAYAKKLLLVTPGNTYTVTVGGVTAGTTSAGVTGNPSWFGTAATVYAQGGAGGAAPNGGTAAGGTGSSASSIGDVVYAGGNGANGILTLSGGGGGGAGSTGTGSNASGTTGGSGTSLNGGNGGTGRTTEGNGVTGSNYGGGGSGAFVPDNTNHSGGSGAAGLVIVSWSVQQIYTSNTTFTVPAGVSSITVECWGAGGAGGGNTTSADGGGGGGGGAYSRSTLTVVPGNSYTVTVGTGGTGSTGNGTAGGDTWFGTAGTILAKGGGGGFAPVAGNGGVAGTGGLAASSIGTVTYSGGNGGTGRDHNNGLGGPGGSSAGTAANGTSGPTVWSTATAGAPPAGGGIGGDGGAIGVNGSSGSVPGGGGGGSGEGNRSGGAGAGGQVKISWTTPVFYSQVSGDPSVLSNWKTSAGYSPLNFTTSDQTFAIQNGHTMTTTGSGWTVSGSNSIVEIQSGGTFTENFSASFSINSTLLVDNGGTINHNVNSLTVFGGSEIFGNTSTVNYGYAGAQTVIDATYGNLTLSGSGLKTFSTITVNGILSMEGSATASAAPAYGSGATLRYRGSVAQTTGPEFPASFTSTGGVIIDNINGVSLNSNRTIDILLEFVNGRLLTGANALIIGINGSITGAGSGKYVYGNLQLDIDAATAAATFDIGDANAYTPVNIVFAGVTNGTGNIVAYTTPGDHPNIGTSAINPTYSVNRFWNLTNNGVTGFTSYDATFTFVAGDMDAGTDYNYFIIGDYNLATWSYPTVGAKSSTSTQTTGMTTFGAFQIGHMVSDFRSAGSGNWDQNSTWEVFAGGSWIPAPITPTSANGTITIRNTNNVSVNSPVAADQLTVNAGGTLTLGANVTIQDGSGTDITVSGTINCSGTNNLTGTGSFVLSPSATIIIGSPDGITSSGASGSIQTATRTFDAGANYNYNGAAAQVTGNGLPATINDLTINNASGVALSSSVAVSGTLFLTAGSLAGGSNSVTFLNSDTPVSRTSGTITTTSSTDLAFGTAGNTGGAAFTIPSGTFTSAPDINNLTIYRVNGITLNEQLMSVSGIVLCNAPLNTNGNLLLLSTAARTALINGSGTGQVSGNVTMQRYSPTGFGYKYISSPFQASLVSELGDEVNLGSSFPLLYRYDENRTSSGWVSYVNPVNVLNPLSGYCANFGSSAVPVTADITGVVNNGPLSVTLYNHNYTYTQGLNLVGNPYPSAIDWNAGAGWTKTNIDNALYYFSASATDQYGGTYSSYINGVSSDGIASNIIPSMQGFFVHVSNGAYPVTGTLGMTNSVRITDATHTFIKGNEKSNAPLLRLRTYFSDDTASSDPFVVYTDDKASDQFDSNLDARKLLNTDLMVPNIYSLSQEGIRQSINALPVRSDFTYTVPLGVKLNRDGQLVFRIKNCDEQYISAGVRLTDLTSGIVTDLIADGQYSLNLVKGEYLNRFVLTIGSVTTEITESAADVSLFRIYPSEGMLKVEINRIATYGGTLKLFDLTGRTMLSESYYAAGVYELYTGLEDGFYIATFYSGREMSSVKIFLSNR